jgi:tol-pal system protein YbgF
MRRSAILLLFAGLLLTLPVARAQDSGDARALSDRLDRLERDMNLLQRQVYRGSPSGAAGASGPQALSSELQSSQQEDEIRRLTGRIEELSNRIDQLNSRLDRLSSDVDTRFSGLGQGAAAAPASNLPGSPPPPPGRGANAPGPATTSGTLGTLSSDNGATVASAATGSAAGNLPSGSPQDQYNYAFGLLQRADYPNAEQALRSFVAKYPTNPLAGNAQYWLGETYYVRKDYNNAAVAFAEGYQKYPKGPKGPDTLLKLAESLAALGQKPNACAVYGRLEHDFPVAPAPIKERAAADKQKLAC